MQRSLSLRILAQWSLAILLLASAGCGSRRPPPPPKPKVFAYDVNFVSKAPDMTMEVVVFPVKQNERKDWEDMPVTGTDGFFPGAENSQTESEKLVLSGRDSKEQAVPKKKMQEWVYKQYTHLVAFARIPDYVGPSGKKDSRRLIISLDRRVWVGNEIRVSVSGRGLKVDTDQSPQSYKYE